MLNCVYAKSNSFLWGVVEPHPCQSIYFPVIVYLFWECLDSIFDLFFQICSIIEETLVGKNVYVFHRKEDTSIGSIQISNTCLKFLFNVFCNSFLFIKGGGKFSCTLYNSTLMNIERHIFNTYSFINQFFIFFNEPLWWFPLVVIFSNTRVTVGMGGLSGSWSKDFFIVISQSCLTSSGRPLSLLGIIVGLFPCRTWWKVRSDEDTSPSQGRDRSSSVN